MGISYRSARAPMDLEGKPVEPVPEDAPKIERQKAQR